MSLRSIIREQSDFVVRFVTDGSVMVRQKQHIYTDGKVKEGEIYNVKWGTSEASSSDAVIIASGDYISMAARARMEKEDKHNSLQSPTPPPTKCQKIQPAQKKQPSSPRMPPSRRKLIKSVTKSGKPPARVLMVISPTRSPKRHPTPTPTTAREEQP